MSSRKNKHEGLKPYFRAVPDILRYQAASKTLMFVLLAVLRYIMRGLLHSTGRAALTSGDFRFLFVTWQGILLIALSLLVLLLYVVFDLNTKIVLSGRLLAGEEGNVAGTIRDSIRSIPAFFCADGLGIVLYIALIAPAIGFGLSISLTQNFYIPTFITSVIKTTPLYNLLYTTALIVFLLIGLMNIFCLHGVLLDGLPVRDSRRQSVQMVRKHWKNYIKENVLFTLGFMAAGGAAVLLCGALPIVLGAFLVGSEQQMRFWLVLSAISVLFMTAGLAFVSIPFELMKITQLYCSYRDGLKKEWPQREKKRRPVLFVLRAMVIALVFGAAQLINTHFDVLVPQGTDVRIIAHRGGGSEGAENTVSGMEKAWALGAWGSEIDIQRTADGYYVLNHDTTFARTAGVNRKPEDMTLAEIRALDINGEPVPVLEEMLEACEGKMVLFIELKGTTADRQMAEDTVQILKKMDMVDQAVLISLKYDLIDYIESTWPEIQTGYLTFLSFGDTAALNCDYIGLEEEAATVSVVNAIHEQGKKVLVWTVNEENKQRAFLLRNVDGIITDNVAQAEGIAEELNNRDDVTRLFDLILSGR